MFNPKQYKEALQFLKENRYPTDLIKNMIDFTIIDLANLLQREENRLKLYQMLDRVNPENKHEDCFKESVFGKELI